MNLDDLIRLNAQAETLRRKKNNAERLANKLKEIRVSDKPLKFNLELLARYGNDEAGKLVWSLLEEAKIDILRLGELRQHAKVRELSNEEDRQREILATSILQVPGENEA